MTGPEIRYFVFRARTNERERKLGEQGGGEGGRGEGGLGKAWGRLRQWGEGGGSGRERKKKSSTTFDAFDI